jgi:hypothetical protein
MAYFIFPKNLRSLEEFRKNPHIKIPPKFPCANFQSLGKFKNLSSSLSARLPLPAHSAFGPAGPAGPSPLEGRSQLCRPKPLGPHASLAYLQKYVFFFDSRIPFSVPSLYPTADTWTPLISFIFPPRRSTPAVSPPRRRSPRRPLHTSNATETVPPPPITPPLNPLQTEP